MDSMRSLNKSLPSTSTAQPPELLLQAFKTAALSVTNLYKNAVSDQAQSRHLGYQDALEDLRAFLDKEKIGFTDGEGQRIRNWVMDKIDMTGTSSNDSDDDKADADKTTRAASPAAIRNKTNPDTTTSKSQSEARSRQPSEGPTPPPMPIAAEPVAIVPPRTTAFTFTAGQSLPMHEDIDMKAGMDSSPSLPNDPQITASHPSHPPVRLEVHSRPPRTPHRHGSGNRHNSRSINRDPTPGAGSKRKFHFGEFFDISNLGNGRDTFGGPKRGRFL
ncbi:hypothetical protein McanMca71_005851 [Microsporum canis]|uniref:Uncharacterized protein n=1 Tax=Arthroderma otae (strain ATCC MYA-4605 / CBS 113480) TaxID=554155 RepID=C5FEB5_ARTOC|nr:conserved hypothetical protein [Microsporum canis CBS 113480]EEQ28149.1 conserved hypothetical protein [Microsporum canis CBS 113480]